MSSRVVYHIQIPSLKKSALLSGPAKCCRFIRESGASAIVTAYRKKDIASVPEEEIEGVAPKRRFVTSSVLVSKKDFR